ncbi:SDR family oxidoreductase [Actinomadura decatromicini]|uniref:SDR family oxidoreductase n=1 Tax=Actinomadura decatromicini TaxID=2604572 RepID=A0A5D3G081_9ACTN|nr:SDR family oxidoreductase [Actinomadura decatromicini]
MNDRDDGGGRLFLVTGASGYIGGRLVPELLRAGHRVRCMARSARRLRDHPWAGEVEIVEADATDRESTRRALEGVDVAYYLIHAIGGGSGFAETDRRAARTFADAARDAGVRRLVYLGGMDPAEELSPHLSSRAEVGRIMLDAGVPAVWLRAAVITGSGSASFEMLRYLTERLPVMVTPRWVRTRLQPIAIRDVLHYLVAVADLPADVSRGFDIGGPDVLTYADMMHRYAAVAGLRRRLIIPVPLLSPGLSSLWVGGVTPVPGSLARPLVESLRNEMVCREDDIGRYVPPPPDGPTGFERAVSLALRRVRDADVATRWSSASVPGAPSDPLPTDPDWAGGSLYTDERTRTVDASAERSWTVVEGIGGDRGWYSFPLAWRVRGIVDRLVGGVGLRRGRRDPHRLRIGETVDFWRVEEIEPPRLLRLRAEMRLPGLAWLELRVTEREDGRSDFTQRALFHPRGLSGHAYWWAFKPFHDRVFGGMSRGIARAAERDRPAGAVYARRSGYRRGMDVTRSRELLGIYLNDHLAAAAGGVALARRVARGHRDSDKAERLGRLADDIAADRGALLEILTSLGLPVRRYKSLAVSVAEKAGRLKLNGGLVRRSPLSDVVELEAMTLAVEGKRAGWRTLLAVAEQEPALDTERLRLLQERANDQLAVLERLRADAVRDTFQEPSTADRAAAPLTS